MQYPSGYALSMVPVSHNLSACDVCSKLKMGISGVDVDYEHIRFAGPPLWKLLFKLYQNFFTNSSVPESVLTGAILPLFKGKAAKANNKDNYRRITLFPTLSAKFMRWCWKVYDWKVLPKIKVSFLTCSLDLERGSRLHRGFVYHP